MDTAENLRDYDGDVIVCDDIAIAQPSSMPTSGNEYYIYEKMRDETHIIFRLRSE